MKIFMKVPESSVEIFDQGVLERARELEIRV